MEDGYILTDSDTRFLEGINRASLRFACRISYICGLSIGLSLEKLDREWYLADELFHGFDGLRLSWLHWYGSTQIRVIPGPPYSKMSGFRDDDLCFHFLENGEGRDYRQEVIAAGAEIVERNLCMMLDGIMLSNRLTLCQSGLCSSGVGICRKIGDKWLCNACIDRFSLEEPMPPAAQFTPAEKTEREKMSSSLRWDILARDNFTCKSCGKSPRKGDDIKLHVDHIKPIHHGGKTAPENLQVLCEDCNLGKSDKWSRQLELILSKQEG